jgi:hypothetical protein
MFRNNGAHIALVTRHNQMIGNNCMSLTQVSNRVALVTIYEIGKILSSSLDLHKTLRQVLNVVATHLNMHYQGYLFSKPVPLEEFELLLRFVTTDAVISTLH